MTHAREQAPSRELAPGPAQGEARALAPALAPPRPRIQDSP